MKVPAAAQWLRQIQGRFALICISMLFASGFFIFLNQVLAAVLVVVVGALLLEIEQRNTRARALAERLVAGQALEKLEVPRGAWGELCRAINVLVQEQRTQDRLRLVSSQSIPADGVRALIEGSIPGSGVQRMVAILLIGCGGTVGPRGRMNRPSVSTWQNLAAAARSLAEQHGALVQPCGDAIMLVFGAFTERPLDESLRAATSATASLHQRWSPQAAPLALSVTSGLVMVTTLPGVGCYVIGSPVEQAIQIERLAVSSPTYALLCDEAVYYALRRDQPAPIGPTEFRIQTDDGRPQVVYGVRLVARAYS